MTCGTVLKLKHTTNAAQLHSHEIAYGSGSGQQSVTGNPSQDDAGSYWVVQAAEVSSFWHQLCRLLLVSANFTATWPPQSPKAFDPPNQSTIDQRYVNQHMACDDTSFESNWLGKHPLHASPAACADSAPAACII